MHCFPRVVLSLMRKIRPTLVLLGLAVNFIEMSAAAQVTDPTGGPRPEWLDETRLQEGCEPAAATMTAFADERSARTLSREQSPFRQSLNGEWKYHWSPNPDNRVADFWGF